MVLLSDFGINDALNQQEPHGSIPVLFFGKSAKVL